MSRAVRIGYFILTLPGSGTSASSNSETDCSIAYIDGNCAAIVRYALKIAQDEARARGGRLGDERGNAKNDGR